MSMASLKGAFVGAGFADAVTHIQTGNVIFTSEEREAPLKKTIEGFIASEVGMKITALLRTAKELDAITKANPFLPEATDTKRLYVTFLEKAPDKAAVAALKALSFAGDEFEVRGREVYLDYPNGAGLAKLSNAVLEKKLGVAGTARNWNVTTKLAELAKAHRR